VSSSSETREIWTEIKYYENILDFDLLHEFVLRAAGAASVQFAVFGVQLPSFRAGRGGGGELFSRPISSSGVRCGSLNLSH
jgi:hypothetical protein